ncbi:MAG: phage tail protein [Bacteroidales bacterium]|nr:phage tail protein [Bacteroidales bacterium]
MPRRENDPFASFNFLVESGGLLRAGFSECTGLNSETDPIDYREGKDDITVRKLPGLTKFGNITLKRGVAVGQDFFEWRKSVTDGNIDRRDISIILLDEQRNEQLRYNLTSAWPAKWTGPEFKAGANEVAVETIEIIHEGVKLG